jgi:indole-3-glycerol phosphate synthase
MNILDEIVARRRERLAQEQAALPLAEIQARLRGLEDRPRPFAAVLRGPTVRVIAEIKRASPSQGQMVEFLDPRTLAQDYAGSGAAALSVLTEQDYFQGESHSLRRARRAMALPVLRKDFLTDAYQLYESRLLLADAVLLIARVLSPGQLADYLALTRQLGMEALVETHNAAEIETALGAGARVIGLNNRDLNTLETSLEVTERLAALVPPERTLVSESGIHCAADVERLAAVGVEAILVGGHLMQSEDPGRALRELVGIASNPEAR